MYKAIVVFALLFNVLYFVNAQIDPVLAHERSLCEVCNDFIVRFKEAMETVEVKDMSSIRYQKIQICNKHYPETQRMICQHVWEYLEPHFDAHRAGFKFENFTGHHLFPTICKSLGVCDEKKPVDIEEINDHHADGNEISGRKRGVAGTFTLKNGASNHFPIISVVIKYGTQQREVINQVNTGVLVGNSLVVDLTQLFQGYNGGSFNWECNVGWWDNNVRNGVFRWWGTGSSGSEMTVNDPSIAQLLSQWSQFKIYRGMYWVGTSYNYAYFKFYASGQYQLFDGNLNNQIGSGVVTLTQWSPQNSLFIKFKLCGSCEEILWNYPWGSFKYRNGPSDWPIIEYIPQ